ncbi:MAG: SsrA RNA (tmRNA)-binding protein [uncultured bacterium (gcode 4)]|uniref:SsrA-binding protein n=1 Tax=uncultured bacterium (gcode 4) TaxID=1234023 RepID=K2G3M7_9BACT|nr:MAG: SsrA RNA (tmRNA)-binding protein [uncultured bacterium (gcode 4)]
MEKIEKKLPKIHPLLVNKKALSDYEVIKEYECGIKLEWHEVKAIRGNQFHMKASFVTIRDGDVYIQKFHISPYKQFTNKEAYDPEKERKLLLHKKSIDALSQKIKEKWFTIIPTEVYFKWNLIKMKIALGRWKKQYEKKEALKKRDIEMDIRRSLSERG